MANLWVILATIGEADTEKRTRKESLQMDIFRVWKRDLTYNLMPLDNAAASLQWTLRGDQAIYRRRLMIGTVIETPLAVFCASLELARSHVRELRRRERLIRERVRRLAQAELNGAAGVMVG